jgi:hypothetical protein
MTANAIPGIIRPGLPNLAQIQRRSAELQRTQPHPTPSERINPSSPELEPPPTAASSRILRHAPPPSSSSSSPPSATQSAPVPTARLTTAGLIHAVRDQQPPTDRRLLALSEEFASVLHSMGRTRGQLSPLLCSAWDNGHLRSLVTRQLLHATGPPLSHIADSRQVRRRGCRSYWWRGHAAEARPQSQRLRLYGKAVQPAPVRGGQRATETMQARM